MYTPNVAPTQNTATHVAHEDEDSYDTASPLPTSNSRLNQASHHHSPLHVGYRPPIHGATVGFLRRHRFPFERTVSSPEFQSSLLQRPRFPLPVGQTPPCKLEHGKVNIHCMYVVGI